MSSDNLGGMDGPLSLAVEIAQAESKKLHHDRVGVAHLFLGLLQAFPQPMQKLLDPFGLKREDTISAVRAALPAPIGDDRDATPTSPMPATELLEVLKLSELIAGDTPVQCEHVVVGMLRHPDNLPKRLLQSFGVEPRAMELNALTSLTPPRAGPGAPGEDASASPGARATAVSATPTPQRDSLIDQLTRDLVKAAAEGDLDPVIGREKEIDTVLEVLARRRKNNPVLVGEPGVGKSAIVEGLAARIAEHQVPKRLENLRIRELSAADLVAGTQYRGDFETRILKLVQETSEDRNIVLFIDEIHTILAAGGQQGTGDAAALLKPHLARGEIRCIGATTTDEFRKFIEKDRALVRRFQPVNVPEPSVEDCLEILIGLAPRFEEHHQLKLDRSALEAAIFLSKKHIADRHLPDKAIDLVDQACARKSLRNPDDTELKVVAQDIADLLRDQLGKNLGEITLDESQKLLGIEKFLRSRVIGQDHVAQQVAERIRLTKRELDFRPERPTGVFLFLGPTGVGKTEVARCLAEYMLGSRQKLLRYDLSEYAEPHSVAKIIGSPPGYVGYEDEGHQLTSKIRSNPQTILLLDEIEKAHPSVLNLFLQVFEDGRLTDAQGRTVSFSEVTIILTSNIGAGAFQQKASIGFGGDAEATQEEVREEAKEVLKQYLPPELLNRVDGILVFNSLTPDDIRQIARNLVERAVARFELDGKTIEVDESAIEFLGDRGHDAAYGARHLQRNVEQLMLQPLARETYLSDWSSVEKIIVRRHGSGLEFEKVMRSPAKERQAATGEA